MSTTIQTIRTKQNSKSPADWWIRMTRVLAQWRDRARSRRELANLTDRELRDMGLSRYSVELESAKPFWQA